jgi:hypothetical protein
LAILPKTEHSRPKNYWNIWLTPFYSLKAIEITYRILRSLKKIDLVPQPKLAFTKC